MGFYNFLVDSLPENLAIAHNKKFSDYLDHEKVKITALGQYRVNLSNRQAKFDKEVTAVSNEIKACVKARKNSLLKEKEDCLNLINRLPKIIAKKPTKQNVAFGILGLVSAFFLAFKAFSGEYIAMTVLFFCALAPLLFLMYRIILYIIRMKKTRLNTAMRKTLIEKQEAIDEALRELG